MMIDWCCMIPVVLFCRISQPGRQWQELADDEIVVGFYIPNRHRCRDNLLLKVRTQIKRRSRLGCQRSAVSIAQERHFTYEFRCFRICSPIAHNLLLLLLLKYLRVRSSSSSSALDAARGGAVVHHRTLLLQLGSSRHHFPVKRDGCQNLPEALSSTRYKPCRLHLSFSLTRG